MGIKDIVWKLRSQKGFTLLELLVVIAIVGILATLAVPRFQGQMDKARFTEVVSATAPYKAAVEVCAQRNPVANCVSGALGVPAAVGASANIASVAVTAGGVITATAIAALGNGATYVITPTAPAAAATGGSALTWVNSGSCLATALCD